MLTFVFLLAFASFAFEMLIASKFPLWRKLAYKSKLANLTMSILLSYLLGIAFGAAGLITMTAAILSTLMSIPGYTILAWNFDTPKAQALPERSRYQHESKKWKQVGSDTVKMTYGTLRVITAPVWISRKIYKSIKG
jgi:hypothetical protein